LSGRDKLNVLLKKTYHWKGLKNGAWLKVHQCIHCQKIRHRRNLPKPPLKPMVYKRLMECIQIDLTFLPEQEDYIGVLTIIDCCSKFVWAYPIRTKESANVARILYQLFTQEGDPEFLQSDNGKEFVSKIIKELTNLLNMEPKRSRPKHPQTNGTVEQANKTIKSMLREAQKLHKNVSWVKLLPAVVRQYNNTPHGALPGLTPFQRHRAMVPINAEQRKYDYFPNMKNTNASVGSYIRGADPISKIAGNEDLRAPRAKGHENDTGICQEIWYKDLSAW